MPEDRVDIYEPVIAELKAQMEECQRVISMLELMRSKAGFSAPIASVAAAAIPSQPNGIVAFANDAFFGMTIADAAKKYLAATKKTATARVISDALIAGGFKTSAKNFVENVRSILSRNSGIAFVNGEYGLAEWYPGRKSSAKARPVAQAAVVEDVGGDDLEEVEDVIDPAGRSKTPTSEW
jgi:hypothetical protein